MNNTDFILNASVDFVKKIIKETHPDTNVVGTMLKTVIEAAGIKNPEINYVTKSFLGKQRHYLVISADGKQSSYKL